MGEETGPEAIDSKVATLGDRRGEALARLRVAVEANLSRGA